MNMNKKLDRFKQWAGERMGGEAKTETSEQFKSLEQEMDLRQNGMDKLHTSMNSYVKSMSQRREGEDKEKMLPLDMLAQAMIAHGEEFETESLFGTCLIMMGQANEKIARVQDSFVASASESWLESLERSLAQMKEYQTARRKLESRRLAYDATLSKMQKQKKEDFRLEEELRNQRIKYEESSDDVYRRMGEIQEAEQESMTDLGAFMDAELEYHERSAEVLRSLRKQWPAGMRKAVPRNRARSTTAHSYGPNGAREQTPSPPPMPEPERIRSVSRVSTGLSDRSVERVQTNGFRLPTPDQGERLSQKPVFQRSNTSTPAFEGPTTSERMVRNRSDNGPTPKPIVRSRTQAFDQNEDDYNPRERIERPTGKDNGYSPGKISSGNGSAQASRTSSSNAVNNQYDAGAARKGAPPPPPLRKKPPPPPPPMKKPGLASQ